LRVGLAAALSLGDLEVAARLKWPNDVVLSDRRLGGVLLVETEQEVQRILGGGIAAA
jgi:biotin-(acetyl-CoA carboxylase) ligase